METDALSTDCTPPTDEASQNTCSLFITEQCVLCSSKITENSMECHVCSKKVHSSCAYPSLDVTLVKTGTLLWCCNDCSSDKKSEKEFLKNELTKIEEMLSQVNQEVMKKVLYWFANAGLQVNESKTEAILISSVKNAPSISSIKVRNVEVKLSNSLKCLGVTIEKHLDMEKQVKTVAKNCFHYLRILHSLRNFVDFETRILLVRCLIMSRLDYCNSILNGLGMKKLSILQKVQNRACRFDYRLHPWCSISIHLHDHHWLPIYMRIRFKILLLVYKSLFHKDLIPDYLDVFEKRAKTS